MPVEIYIDASIQDENGNIDYGPITLVEGDTFSVTIGNVVGYLESRYQTFGIPVWISSATVIPGTAEIGASLGFNPAYPEVYNLVAPQFGLPLLDPASQNEEIRPTFSYEFSYTSDSFTISGEYVENFSLGTYIDQIDLSVNIQVTASFLVDGVWMSETFVPSFGGGFGVVASDNDVWGTQALEDAKNARLQELQSMEELLGEMNENLGELFAQLDSASGAIPGQLLETSLGLAGVFMTGAALVLAGPEYALLRGVLSAGGLGTSIGSLVVAKDTSSVVGVVSDVAEVQFDLIAEFTTLTGGQQNFLKAFGAVANLMGILDAASSVADLRAAGLKRGELKQMFDDAGIATLDLTAALTQLQLDFGKFAEYYGEGVRTGAHDPDSFSSPFAMDVQSGTGAANYIAGFEQADEIKGLKGDDILSGLGGDDALFGGSGRDVLDGGAGDDVLNGGKGVDRAVFSGPEDMTVSLRPTSSGATGQGNDQLIGIENVTTAGGNDRITGNNKTNVLSAGSGNDRLFGGGKGDTLDGGAGRDRLFGGAGHDDLTGGKGNDLLFGGGGRDWIYGGRGKDDLTGGGGGDQFIFTSLSEMGKNASKRDLITDFSQAEGDVIDLSEIDAKSGPGNQAFTFIGMSAFSSAKGELRYRQTSDTTIVQGDTDGDGVKDFEIALAGVIDLTVGDFIL